jgi:hypothetical protein
MKKGLIVFAREPLPGKVKTRLAASLGNEISAEIYEGMLREVLQAACQLNDVDTVVYWSARKESLPLLAEQYKCRSRLQTGVDLGQRMQAAFEEMFLDDYSSCCIIGSDAPDLPVAYIREAYRFLDAQDTDVVLGPSRDGGYYLLGMKQVMPRLFANITWSSPVVLEQSLAAAMKAGLSTTLLPEWQDIDTLDDLQAYYVRNQGTV